MKATVLIPTYDHGPLLRFAVTSALEQTVKELEVFIIGDGISPEGQTVVEEFTQADPRVRFFDHPKHEREGEPYRHAALQEAQGEIVCYLADRDLWFPDHVERLYTLLQEADFAHSFSFYILPEGELLYFPMDLRHPGFRQLIVRGKNGITFSSAAHTLEFYRRLPHGWQTTPSGKSTDLHMFQQILSVPNVRGVSSHYPTVLTFPSSPRKSWPLNKRTEELSSWQTKIQTVDQRTILRLKLMELGLQDRDQWIATLLGERHRPPMTEPPPPTFSASDLQADPILSHMQPFMQSSSDQPEKTQPDSPFGSPETTEPEAPAEPEPPQSDSSPETPEKLEELPPSVPTLPVENLPEENTSTTPEIEAPTSPTPEDAQATEPDSPPKSTEDSFGDSFWSQEEIVDDMALIKVGKTPKTPTWEPGPADDIYTPLPDLDPLENFSDPVPLPKPAPIKNGPAEKVSRKHKLPDDTLPPMDIPKDLLPPPPSPVVKKPNYHTSSEQPPSEQPPTEQPPTEQPNWHLPGMTRDKQNMDPDRQQSDQPLIDGVVFKQVRNIPTDYGHLCEAYRPDWNLDERGVGQVSYAVLEPGAISGWLAHDKTTDRLCVAQGQLLIVLFDARTDSPTYGTINRFRLGTASPGLLVVPPGIWRAVHNTASVSGLLINIVDHAYQYEAPDHYRLPLDTDRIPYRFRSDNSGKSGSAGTE